MHNLYITQILHAPGVCVFLKVSNIACGRPQPHAPKLLYGEATTFSTVFSKRSCSRKEASHAFNVDVTCHNYFSHW